MFGKGWKKKSTERDVWKKVQVEAGPAETVAEDWSRRLTRTMSEPHSPTLDTTAAVVELSKEVRQIAVVLTTLVSEVQLGKKERQKQSDTINEMKEGLDRLVSILSASGSKEMNQALHINDALVSNDKCEDEMRDGRLELGRSRSLSKETYHRGRATSRAEKKKRSMDRTKQRE
jgi:hypothetical protein